MSVADRRISTCKDSVIDVWIHFYSSSTSSACALCLPPVAFKTTKVSFAFLASSYTVLSLYFSFSHYPYSLCVPRNRNALILWRDRERQCLNDVINHSRVLRTRGKQLSSCGTELDRPPKVMLYW